MASELRPLPPDGARACGIRCPCRGRTDHLDLMPTICCARRAAEAAARRQTEGDQ